MPRVVQNTVCEVAGPGGTAMSFFVLIGASLLLTIVAHGKFIGVHPPEDSEKKEDKDEA